MHIFTINMCSTAQINSLYLYSKKGSWYRGGLALLRTYCYGRYLRNENDKENKLRQKKRTKNNRPLNGHTQF